MRISFIISILYMSISPLCSYAHPLQTEVNQTCPQMNCHGVTKCEGTYSWCERQCGFNPTCADSCRIQLNSCLKESSCTEDCKLTAYCKNLAKCEESYKADSKHCGLNSSCLEQAVFRELDCIKQTDCTE